MSFHPECNALVGTGKGGCAAVLRSLPHHPYSAENVTHAFNAVWALAEDPENNRTFLAQGHGLVDEVVKALVPRTGGMRGAGVCGDLVLGQKRRDTGASRRDIGCGRCRC